MVKVRQGQRLSGGVVRGAGSGLTAVVWFTHAGARWYEDWDYSFEVSHQKSCLGRRVRVSDDSVGGGG